MADDVLLIEESGGIARLTLNRPQRLNALNPALATALRGYFQGLYRRHDVRVVILQGAGANFCAGLDLKEQTPGRDLGAQGMMDVQHSIRDIMVAMRRCPQPIICIAQGAASGGGFALALASDVRLVTPDSRMNAAFIRIGLTGCDMGISYFLPRAVGAGNAAEMMMTGRFVDAAKALRIGLASEVCTPDALAEAGAELAAEMAAMSPLGLRLTKEGLNMAQDAGSLEAVIALEDRGQVMCLGPFLEEGAAAFMDKRPARYSDE